jgi:leucyl-tRNA synthetase
MGSINFPAEEERVLKAWEESNAFHRQLELTKDNPPYVFYDGPPFATGTPHYGHLLASTIKDIIPRYWSMRGRYVERRFGWDTHGVPIEQIIDKQLQEELGVRGKAAVDQIGIAEYNRRCRGRHDLRERVEESHWPPGKMDRLRQGLQDHEPDFHGVLLVGFQAATQEELGLPRCSRPAIQHSAQHTIEQE